MAKHMVRKPYLHGILENSSIDPRKTGHRVAYDREVPFELRVQAAKIIPVGAFFSMKMAPL